VLQHAALVPLAGALVLVAVLLVVALVAVAALLVPADMFLAASSVAARSPQSVLRMSQAGMCQAVASTAA